MSTKINLWCCFTDGVGDHYTGSVVVSGQVTLTQKAVAELFADNGKTYQYKFYYLSAIISNEI